MTNDHIVFNYAWYHLTYSHDINLYYRWFVWRPWERRLYHSSMYYLSYTILIFHIKVPWIPTYFALIKSVSIHFLFLTWIHFVFFISMVVYYWGWVCLTQEYIVYLGYFLVWLAGAFQLLRSISYSFTILPLSLMSISMKSIRIK